MTLIESLPEKAAYERHREGCHACRFNTNPLVWGSEVEIPRDLCPRGQQLYEALALAAWEEFKAKV